MKRIIYDDSVLKKISNILKTKKFDSLIDLDFSEKVDISIIYPTNDYLLNELQFQLIVQLLDEGESLYIMQLDDNDLYSLDNALYKLDYPYSYQDYEKLELYSISMIFSSKLEWIIFIDESLDGGIGVLAGENSKIKKFETSYGKTKRDICQLASFFLDDANRNPNALMYMKRLFNLITSQV